MLIVSNWKMNGTIYDVETFIAKLQSKKTNIPKNIGIIICPPFTLIQHMKTLMNDSISIGAQNCSEFTNGAFTGEISCAMLADIGCKFVIIGHTERRNLFQETNSTIKKKIDNALKHNITPIVCLNKEDSDITDNGLQEITKQCEDFNQYSTNIIIAYEPKWCIGTGITPSNQHIQIVTKTIKQSINSKVLYGGSVSETNMQELLSLCDGLLIGGLSLKFDNFINAICNINTSTQC